MKKNMYFDYFGGDCIAALTEEDRLVEFHLDAKEQTDMIGNVYKGRVVNVLPGMQAAFVNFGFPKNGYLFAGDMPAEVQPAAEGSVLNVNVGDEVMVQVTKMPIGTKGARLSMNISVVGKNIIYLPGTPFVGVSRKITEESERAKLTGSAEKICFEGDGVIMRTNARTATFRQVKNESKYLRELYEEMRERYRSAEVGEVVYRSADVHLKLIRDCDLEEVDKIYTAGEAIYDKVDRWLRSVNSKNKLVCYKGEREMFAHFGLESEISKLVCSRVDLVSGAYLCFDKTEALTAIDVNTGRFTGENNLEETVFQTNLLAAREIARQVRLRNIGGIVVVDFIDMQDAEHQAAVTRELETALKQDRAKCNVTGMSALGLVQFTRKKEKRDNLSLITKPCTHCNGSGKLLSDAYLAYKIKIALKDLFADGYENAVVELNAGLYSVIVGEHYFSAEVRNEWRAKRVYMIPHKTYHEEYFTVRGDNNSVMTLPSNAQLLY